LLRSVDNQALRRVGLVMADNENTKPIVPSPGISDGIGLLVV
jgi:hypothetical protein